MRISDVNDRRSASRGRLQCPEADSDGYSKGVPRSLLRHLTLARDEATAPTTHSLQNRQVARST